MKHSVTITFRPWNFLWIASICGIAWYNFGIWAAVLCFLATFDLE